MFLGTQKNRPLVFVFYGGFAVNKQTIASEYDVSRRCLRLAEEKDYFESLTGNFKSGVVSFPFNCTLDQEFNYSFEGRKITAMIQELPDIISKFADSYDRVVLNYKTRGEMLIIEAADKNVTMKTKALEEEKESIIKVIQIRGLSLTVII